jgi:hypothetical protein
MTFLRSYAALTEDAYELIGFVNECIKQFGLCDKRDALNEAKPAPGFAHFF